MKAVSLWEPWASLIALGQKTIETRSWPTRHRGLIAIHAAKKWDRELADLSESSPFGDALPLDWKPALGLVVAVAELFDCRQVTRELQVQIKQRLQEAQDAGKLSEYMWGDYTAGRWMWMLRNVRAIDPVPAQGAQGLWEWDPPALVVREAS